MRPLLLPGLLDAARAQRRHDRGACALFESAHVYRMAAGGGTRPRVAARGRGAGRRAPPPGRADQGAGVAPPERRRLLRGQGRARGLLADRPASPRGSSRASGRSCTPVAPRGSSPATVEIGWIGELHPLVARAWDLGGRSRRSSSTSTRSPSSAPARRVPRRDELPRGSSRTSPSWWPRRCPRPTSSAVRRAAATCSSDARVFDVYRGEQVGEGNKSLALRLEFRAPDRTLTDEEVAERRAEIEAALDRDGGKLRG